MKIVYYNEIPVIKLDKTYEGKEMKPAKRTHIGEQSAFFF